MKRILLYWIGLTAMMAYFSPAFAAVAAEPNLLSDVKPENLARIRTKDAAVSQDAASKSLTITFRYTDGEPEVRIPIRQMNWQTDWQKYAALVFTFYTSNIEPFSVGFSDGANTKFFLIEPLGGMRIKAVVPLDIFNQTKAMDPIKPVGYKVWTERGFTFDRVEELVFKMKQPGTPTQLTIYDLTLAETAPRDEIIDKRPVLDRYGQWIPENWADKAHTDAQLRERWNRDKLAPADYKTCALGGSLALPQRKATGFFRTERVGGKWFFVDPHGHLFYSAGMDLVGYKQGSYATNVADREYLFEELPPKNTGAWLDDRPGWRNVSFYNRNIIERFGADWERDWTTHILARLKNWGFNTIANWSDEELAINSQMPYVLPLYGWYSKKRFAFPYNFYDVFSEEFEKNCDLAARKQVEGRKTDPNLIGWFLDNELAFARRSFGDPRRFADIVLADKEPSGVQAKLKELLAQAKTPAEAEEIKQNFVYTCGKKYFDTIAAAVRKHDPNHLLLGVRFAEKPDKRWAEASRTFDVFSINIYSDTYAPVPELVKMWAETAGRPVVIGEFTAAAPGRGLQGLFYNVHKVRDQAERGIAYRYYVEQAAANPYIVGTHWFQMVDDAPTGRPMDGERMNYGFINVIDLPYPDLVNAARQTHRRIYELKTGAARPFNQVPRAN